MEKIKAIFKTAWPYKDDQMNLPVNDLEAAIPFYETMMGFTVLEKREIPHRSAVLGRDTIRIGLAENGGDPTQDGCFFAVDNIHAALLELQAAGLEVTAADLRIDKNGDDQWKVFFVVAPDGLCYCLGEKQYPPAGVNE